jgi:IMP dehydrogenase
MIVKEVMSNSIVTVNDFDTLTDAAALMEEYNVGFLAVQNARGETIGAVTDRDIVIRGISRGLEVMYTPVKRVTTNSLVSCRFDASIETALKMMMVYKIRRIVVVDAKGHPMGVVSLGDLAAGIHEPGFAGEALKQISSISTESVVSGV